jgi:uroporphyrinogen-III synthase
MSDSSSGALDGLVVLALESRRASEMAELIRRHGGTPMVAPSMREVPLAENEAAAAFVDALEDGAIDVVILLTGVGTRTLAWALSARCPRERFAELLARTRLVARGPKPVSALRELGLAPDITIPEPNTWREILATLDRELPVERLRVAVQEYGVSNPELIAGLRDRGAEVTAVPVYRWALPEDTGPLRAAVTAVMAGRVDAILCTSATQVHHLFRVALESGRDLQSLRDCFDRVLVASIGPVCSEALLAHGLSVDLEPEHPRMGQLVSAVARRGRVLLAAKRSSSR